MSSAAVEAKSARACDYCVGQRARWYCAADDAFLCQPCDSSVHSANTVARRHERLRLNSASSSLKPYCIPSWPHRRPRTPRHAKLNVPSTSNTTSPEDADYDDQTPNQLQLLYRVPDSDYTEIMLHHNSPQRGFLNLDMDMDMEDFAADMESFLGGESYDDLGLLVKAEEEEDDEETLPFELTFDYNSPVAMEQKSMSLRLDYDAISSAWATQGSPWINGQRPQVTPNDFWFHSTAPTAGSSTTIRAIGCQSSNGDGGREARVSRYREKRRTRLFSKKIRYEVRKLNAEKRPRMKGRFVKRSSFNPTPSHLPLLTK